MKYILDFLFFFVMFFRKIIHHIEFGKNVTVLDKDIFEEIRKVRGTDLTNLASLEHGKFKRPARKIEELKKMGYFDIVVCTQREPKHMGAHYEFIGRKK